MLHPRLVTPALLKFARGFAAVAILGPRQIGKSTLARLAFKGHAWMDLENPDDAHRLERDPMFLLEQSKRWVLDEVQRMPELFPALRHFLDADPGRRLVLLGSASPVLVSKLSESLTGRVGVFELPGVTAEEVDPLALWLKGGFPRLHWGRPRALPETWFPSYLRTTLEQDVPTLGVRATFRKLHDFMSMLAHSQGGVSNLAEWAGALGVDYHTVSHWLDVLEGVFLVRRLRPWFSNLGKRLVKSPKVYVRDTGLLHSLLGIRPGLPELLRHPKAGASFESFCLEQLITHAKVVDPSSDACFFRTQTGVEVDLLLKLRGRLVPIEVKLGTAAPSTSHLEICMSDLGLREGYVVSRATRMQPIARGIRMGPLSDVLARLKLTP